MLTIGVPRHPAKNPSCAAVCQAGALQQRAGSLEALTLRACDLMDHDPDMPLIFDLRPLALVRARAWRHISFLRGIAAQTGNSLTDAK